MFIKMLDTYSELGRPPSREISATRGGPLIRRGFTPHPPAGERGIGSKPPNALEDQVWTFFVCLFSTAVADVLLLLLCDMGGTERSTEGKYDAT